MTNLLGIPNGASSALMNIFHALRSYPEGAHHLALALTLDGPVLVSSPVSGGLIVFETNESRAIAEHKGIKGRAFCTNVMDQSLNYDLPCEYRIAPEATLKDLGWKIFDVGKPTPAESLLVLKAFDTNALLSAWPPLPNQSSSLDIASTQQHRRHLTDIPASKTTEIAMYCAQAFIKAIAGRPIVFDGFEQDPDTIRRPDELLPVLLAHAAMDWTPIVSATGHGFAIRLGTDPCATYGYRILSIAADNHLFISLAVMETTKRLIRDDGHIDIGTSVRKFRKWLVKHGYSTTQIDTFVD